MAVLNILKLPFLYMGTILLSIAAYSHSEGIDTTQIPLTMTTWGARGLTQTASAESQGVGRLTVNLSGNWYQQNYTISDAPNIGANIGTGTMSFSFATSNYIELFATMSIFGINNYSFENGSGIGSVSGGILGMLPLPKEAPFRLGAQITLFGGTSNNQINNNDADGYNYFETRTGYDFMGRLIQSFIMGNEKALLKIMLNEAFVTSVGNQPNLIMLSAGLQGTFARYFGVGVELNSRTNLGDMAIKTDPLWITPSITIRTPYFVSFGFGADISLSSEREISSVANALEKYRLFGSTTFSVDVLARKRREAAEKAKLEAQQKADLEQKAKQLEAQTDALTKKAHADSLAQQRRADSLALVAQQLSEKTKEVSAAMSDSLAQMKKALDEEKSKRSEAEKQLLSTGMLLLDAVYFESGKAEISINSKPYLNIIGKMLEKYPLLLLEVGGHTDNLGSYDRNLLLSQMRAESVRAYLISVAPKLNVMLSSKGYGPNLPKADNKSADGRKVNRRVELKVTNPDALQEYNK